MAVAVLVDQNVVSAAVGRARPCAVMPDVQPLLPCSADFSMPSDHAVIAGALVVGLWILQRRLGAVAAVSALVLAFARIYVGVHYPSDVAVGLLFGALWPRSWCSACAARRPSRPSGCSTPRYDR